MLNTFMNCRLIFYVYHVISIKMNFHEFSMWFYAQHFRRILRVTFFLKACTSHNEFILLSIENLLARRRARQPLTANRPDPSLHRLRNRRKASARVPGAMLRARRFVFGESVFAWREKKRGREVREVERAEQGNAEEHWVKCRSWLSATGCLATR